MQSSSKLFPVALVSAELRGDLVEDVYRLKPNNSPDRSVELALTRLGLAGAARRGVPVILLHGGFANRRCWYSAGGHGLGAWLARAGFDVWLAEMRGHGLSPRNQRYRNNCMSDYARHDLPAIAAFVAEQCGRPAHWLGHSLGGLSVVAALGCGALAAGQVASLMLFGCQVRRLHWSLKVPPLVWALRLWLRGREQLSAGRQSLGPEDEPLGIVCDALRWYSLWGRFGVAGEDWAAALRTLQVPVLAVAGAGDRTDPAGACRELLECFAAAPRAYLCLGRAQGFAEDYGHAGMLAGRHAPREVWPLIEHWLQHRCLPATVGEASATFA